MNTAQAFCLAAKQVRREHPDYTTEETIEAVRDLLYTWQLEAAHEPQRDDSPCIEPGRDNCDDWGTGEGQYHGRI